MKNKMLVKHRGRKYVLDLQTRTWQRENNNKRWECL